MNVAGEFLPFQEVELHARVAGYIRHISVDIGDKVHSGQVLATLDIPELTAQVQGADAGVRQTQEQITRAKSEVQRAQANYDALHSAAQRLKQALDARPGLIAEQELEDATAKDRAGAAQVDSRSLRSPQRSSNLEFRRLIDSIPISGCIERKKRLW